MGTCKQPVSCSPYLVVSNFVFSALLPDALALFQNGLLPAGAEWAKETTDRGVGQVREGTPLPRICRRQVVQDGFYGASGL